MRGGGFQIKNYIDVHSIINIFLSINLNILIFVIKLKHNMNTFGGEFDRWMTDETAFAATFG